MNLMVLYLTCFLLHSFSLQHVQGVVDDYKIETELVKFTAKYKVGDLGSKIINGTAFFKIEEMQADLSIRGKLIVTLDQQALQIIAKTSGTTDTELTEKIEYESFAFLEHNTRCPKPVLSLQNVKIPYSRGEMVVKELLLPLNFKNSSKNLSDTFCLWVKSNNAGRGHTYRIGNIINEMIKGKTP